MELDAPAKLEFVLYDKTGEFRQTIVPNTVHAELLWNGASFAELTFDDDDKAWSDLGPGSRVRVLVNGRSEIHGPIVEFAGEGPEGGTTITVEDDFRLFRNLGWQVPGAPISGQGAAAYRRYTGPTETVVKAACADLSARMGLGWTIAPNKQLGSAQRVEFRMHPLVDKLVPLLEADALTWTLRDGVVEVEAGDLFPRVLTAESGVLGDYSWRITAPTATQVVVGGEGEGVERLFQRFTNPAAEAEWGFPVEIFKDSRMAQGVTDLSPDGREALAEGSAKVSLTADLIENSWFRYGAYKVGDLVQVQIGPADHPQIDTVEVITQVVIDDTPEEGLTITPHLGEIEDDGDSRLARQVARLSAALRDLRSAS
ncbi:Gp37-like protein [Microbacterium album]|uniref:Gp28/Gp37-like domain-containing protein n=1 Tax=Microbacterium album TaxID=2053191 RepID=A0A917IDE6_9MICO|nr:hypothetical protein [Microbacterium album]GGH34257.1 hypothetical protein GCM10010921_01820 [Microbacterium album]